MNDFESWCLQPENNVESKDFTAAFSKIKKLRPQSTHFVADFDMTLTAYTNPQTKQRSMSSHGALENWSGLSQEVKSKMRELYLKYYPLEISREISDDVKRKAMEEWWEGAHDCIVDTKISRSDIQQIVQQAAFVYRPRLHDFISALQEQGIPLLVFSAGLGDVIEEVLKSQGIANVEIVSNKMRFGSDGICIGFYEPLSKFYNEKSAI